jgi:hypothetical protein
MRMGRRLLARSIFASLTIAAAMAGCGDAPQRPSAGTARGTVEVTPGGVAGSSEIQPGRWRRLPDPPFSPRQGADGHAAGPPRGRRWGCLASVSARRRLHATRTP